MPYLEGTLLYLFGRRRIQIVALVVVAIAGVCATASQTLNSYVVARCVATGSGGYGVSNRLHNGSGSTLEKTK